MKKKHLVLLIITVVTAFLSAYSLAAMNQVYKLDYEWYSQYHNTFTQETRDTSDDRWQAGSYPAKMEFAVFSGQGMNNLYSPSLGSTGYEFYLYPSNRYVYVRCALGEVASPEYRVKFVDIAQRGGVVEIIVCLNSPSAVEDSVKENSYFPEDVIRISKAAFPVKGELHFVFKDQEGNNLFEKSFAVW